MKTLGQVDLLTTCPLDKQKFFVISSPVNGSVAFIAVEHKQTFHDSQLNEVNHWQQSTKFHQDCEKEHSIPLGPLF